MSIVDPSRVRVTGPLTPFKAGFVAELQRQGYTSNSASYQVQLMAHLSRWLAGEGLDALGLSPAVAQRFLEARGAAGYTTYHSNTALVPLLTHLRELGAVPPPAPSPVPKGPVEELLRRYRRYLTVERGLADQSVCRYADAVRPFLEGRVSPKGLEVGQLSTADVSAFVVSRCPHQPYGSANMTVTALRSLLGFLHLEGTIARPLAQAVPTAARWQGQSLPRGLEPDEVDKLLASCDQTTVTGRRDFAILTVLSRLGLRAGEVAGLSLEDIEWRAGEIVVRGKEKREERMPLPADVGEAVASYLRQGRPPGAQGRAVFVRVLAPHRALSRARVGGIVAAAGRRAGVGRVGAHRLRHTAATEALRGGASLPEVGQLLRHHRIATTAIYAKVDREALRRIARPWPGGAR